MQDPDAPAPRPVLHWLVYDIPATMTRLNEGAGNSSSDPRFKQSRNYTGALGYAGPDPEPGRAHRYHFQVFAVDAMLNAEPRETLKETLKDHALAKGELVGSYRLGD
jgi:Raf kinase inhibitor-like YbhB/YbcL family protein